MLSLHNQYKISIFFLSELVRNRHNFNYFIFKLELYIIKTIFNITYIVN